MFASESIITETISLEASRYEYKLQYSGLVSSSETVVVDSLQLLPGIHYNLNPRLGVLTLLFEPVSPTLSISYLIIPDFLLQPHYSFRTTALSDSVFSTVRSPAQQWFGGSSSLLVSGSKTFALSFSDTGDTDLLQSLYVNLSGELSKGVSIDAQLSDSQSRFSPEGDSKELSSLDQVFIRVFGKQWEIGMGDLELGYETSKYMQYRTKLEGVNASYQGHYSAQAAYSAGGGKKSAQQIPIINGKQGPYYLRPNNTQRNFMIVAGSENIYINGNMLERGMDYYIDYSDGSVMFRQLVTSNDLVNIYYQYSDEYYRQSTLFNSSHIPIGERIVVRHHMIHQSDAKNHPLLYSFSPADLDSLAQAGDATVWGEGVFQVEPGSGTYRQLISPEGIVYYEYAASDTLADYVVVFSHVGFGNGDYEEFSTGKYRWVGSGNGSWHPVKQLVAPASRSNLGLSMDMELDDWNLGWEAVYSRNDKNTLSGLSDGDNHAGIFFARITNSKADRPLSLTLDGEFRLADIYLFAPDSPIDYDFASLPRADSLAQITANSTLSYESLLWNPELTLRYRNLDGLYEQRAFRLISRNLGRGFLPAVVWQSSVSSQSGKLAGLLQYHNAGINWYWRAWNLGLLGTLSRLEYDDQSMIDSDYQMLNPYLALKTAHHFTQISLKQDQNSVRNSTWIQTDESTLVTARHMSSTPNHHVDVDISHRIVEQAFSEETPKSSYDLVGIRTNNSLFKGALSLNNNYQLNQTEFYPKIRELVYVGPGIGVYDSTGVVVEGGEWDYEYITASTGQLSSEATALMSMYMKPGLLLKVPFFKRIQSDISLNLIEQSIARDWKSYLFLPEYSFSPLHSLYARQSYLQNIWFDLYQSLILANLNLEITRSLDRRFQSDDRSYLNVQGLQLDIKSWPQTNLRLEYTRESSTDTRYMSELGNSGLKATMQRTMAAQTILQTELGWREETGRQQGNQQNSYNLGSVSALASLRSVFMQKYRVSSTVSLGYNFRKGTSYLSFLPQKRQGLLADLMLSGIYRLNSFSTITMEYKANKYPDQKTIHNLKVEFKAEL